MQSTVSQSWVNYKIKSFWRKLLQIEWGLEDFHLTVPYDLIMSFEFVLTYSSVHGLWKLRWVSFFVIHSFQVFLLMHKESTKVGRQSTWMLSGLSDNYLLTIHFSLWTKSLYNFVAKCLPQLVEKGSEFKPSIVQLLFFCFGIRHLLS